MLNLSFISINTLVSLTLAATSLLLPALYVLCSSVVSSYRHVPGLFLQHALFFNVGCLFMAGFLGHYLYGPELAASLGWGWSPFQYELAFSELALAVLGLLSPLFPRSFWLATIVASSIWLVGASGVHLYCWWCLAQPLVGQAWFAIMWNLVVVGYLIALYLLMRVVCCQEQQWQQSCANH